MPGLENNSLSLSFRQKMIASHRMPVQRTAHYYTIGTPGVDIQYCWFVCHGYGQLAQNFIRKFDVLAAKDTLIVAPEGLSRFYTKGLTGEVGASWMTKEDRLDEIADYANYLHTLYQQFFTQLGAHTRFILLGFSQGCATQLRWILKMLPAFDYLVLWAGTIPEDLDYLPHQSYFSDKKCHFVYGTKDPFVTPAWLQTQQELIEKQHLHFEIATFEGVHTVDRMALKKLSDAIRLDFIQ